jgi:hypothetical protein
MNLVVLALAISLATADGSQTSPPPAINGPGSPPKCVSEVHYQEAKALLEKADEEIKGDRFRDALDLLEKGIAILDYAVGQRGGIDDTGQALSVVRQFESHGNLSAAAITAAGVLRTRIKFSFMEGSPVCARLPNSN